MNLMLILQATTGIATNVTKVQTEMNLWDMYQYGGPIMHVLVIMFALAVYLFIERFITVRTII